MPVRIVVHAVIPCELHDTMEVPHNQYLFENADGEPDWVCGYLVKRAGT